MEGAQSAVSPGAQGLMIGAVRPLLVKKERMSGMATSIVKGLVNESGEY
jgi:hypothetical protein